MIKLKAVEPKGDYRLLLRFSDGTAGIYDFATFIETNTGMRSAQAWRGIKVRAHVCRSGRKVSWTAACRRARKVAFRRSSRSSPCVQRHPSSWSPQL
ncbi:hypothetical protein ACO2Q2_10280 [Dyella sp. KRB-257]|uniref:hypothetical protein n=1 Tax=Dyella sp. KRB-257 TaxID=3400915 RepID=UPI003BFE3E9D